MYNIYSFIHPSATWGPSYIAERVQRFGLDPSFHLSATTFSPLVGQSVHNQSGRNQPVDNQPVADQSGDNQPGDSLSDCLTVCPASGLGPCSAYHRVMLQQKQTDMKLNKLVNY